MGRNEIFYLAMNFIVFLKNAKKRPATLSNVANRCIKRFHF